MAVCKVNIQVDDESLINKNSFVVFISFLLCEYEKRKNDSARYAYLCVHRPIVERKKTQKQQNRCRAKLCTYSAWIWTGV